LETIVTDNLYNLIKREKKKKGIYVITSWQARLFVDQKILQMQDRRAFSFLWPPPISVIDAIVSFRYRSSIAAYTDLTSNQSMAIER
jgi:hypothetical protein